HQLDIGEKLHLDRDGAVALANFTTPARKVEGEVRRIETSRLRFPRTRKHFADRVVNFDVSHGIRTRCTTDWGLVHQNHIVDKLPAFELLKRTDMSLPVAALFLQSRVNAVVNQS